MLQRYEFMRLGTSRYGNMYFPYKYKVAGYPCQWGGYRLFAWRLPNCHVWRLHEFESGGFICTGSSPEKAIERFSELLAKNRREHGIPFKTQIAELGKASEHPEINESLAFGLVGAERENQIRNKKIAKMQRQHREASLGSVSIDQHFEVERV